MEDLTSEMERLATDVGGYVPSESLKWVYAGCLIFVCSIIALVFKDRGFWVTIGILAYVISLSTMTISVKSVFVHQQFNFPWFLTSMHFIFSGILCFGIMMFKQKIWEKEMIVPTRRQMSAAVLPIAACFTASVGANNIALVHSNAAFVEMLSSATPLCIVVINIVEGKGFDMRLISPVLITIGGACLCVSGELHFTHFGMALTGGATFLRACKQNLQQKIMHHNTDIGTLEPIELLAWMSLPCFAMTFLLSLSTEGIQPFLKLQGANRLNISIAIGLTIVNACVLNVASNFVIRHLGAVGYSLTGQLKSILLFLGAAILLGEVIQKQQIAGYTLIAYGVYFYNKIEKSIRDGDPVQNKKDLESLQDKVNQALREDDPEKMPLLK